MDKDSMRSQADCLLRLQAQALDAAANTILITDHRATILWVNGAAVRNYGYQRDELVGRNPRILQSGRHDRAFYADLWGTILKGEPWYGTIYNRKKDGTLIRERMTITPVSDEAGALTNFVAIKEDVTEHKLLEARLHLARFAMDKSSDAIFVADESGQVIHSNGAAGRMMGLSPEALCQRHLYDLDANLDPRRWASRVLRLKAKGSASYESRYTPEQGMAKVVDVSLSHIAYEGADYICASVRDISERRRTEEALRLMVEGTASTTGRAFFKSCVKHLAEVLGTRHALLSEFKPGDDPHVHTLAAWTNQRFIELGDYPLEDNPCAEVILNAQPMVHPRGLRERFPKSSLLQQLLAESYEGLPLIGSDGHVLGHLAVLDDRPLGDGRGRSSILKIFADRAAAELERQKTLERLREAKERADAANRAKGRFLANMSHELRTPLNGILGYAQLLKGDPDMGDKQREGLRVIERSGEHLLDLINDVLDLSKVEAQKVELQPAVFALPHFLDEIARAFAVRAADKGLDFRCELHPRLPKAVQGDERRLRQILFNLLDNAIKFTSAGSVTFAAQPLPDTILFEVRDTGCGIPQGMLPRLFQPFSQVGHHRSGESKGTGLGLAISKKMVELMGGELSVETEPDRGSRFFFAILLPTVRQKPLAAISTGCLVVGYEGSRRRVLAVDSSQQRRTVLRQMLEPVGVVVDERSRRADALTIKDAPDVVLIELGMPEEEGLRVVEAIRHSHWGAKIPILAITPSAHGIDRDAARSAGCTGFVATPYKETELLKSVGQSLGVQWVVRESETASSHDDDIVAPPLKELQQLHELCMLGDVMAVRGRTEALVAENPEYNAFGATLLELAAQFRMKALRELLSQQIIRKQDPPPTASPC